MLPDVYISSLTRKNIHLCAHAPMYTSGSIANSQRMLTEINKIDAIGKIRI